MSATTMEVLMKLQEYLTVKKSISILKPNQDLTEAIGG
jgi:hypothetical protein